VSIADHFFGTQGKIGPNVALFVCRAARVSLIITSCAAVMAITSPPRLPIRVSRKRCEQRLHARRTALPGLRRERFRA